MEIFGAQLFNAFDLNKNNNVDFNEFLIAISLTQDSDPKQKLTFAFRMYDINRGIQKNYLNKVLKLFLLNLVRFLKTINSIFTK
jgi:Ca2+-binding EF-hand superfamily protein